MMDKETARQRKREIEEGEKRERRRVTQTVS